MLVARRDRNRRSGSIPACSEDQQSGVIFATCSQDRKGFGRGCRQSAGDRLFEPLPKIDNVRPRRQRRPDRLGNSNLFRAYREWVGFKMINELGSVKIVPATSAHSESSGVITKIRRDK